MKLDRGSFYLVETANFIGGLAGWMAVDPGASLRLPQAIAFCSFGAKNALLASTAFRWFRRNPM
jgi:hypothetical protein